MILISCFLTVKFTKVKDGDTKTHLLNKQLRYVCAVTGDALGKKAAPREHLTVFTCIEVPGNLSKDFDQNGLNIEF